MAERGKAINRRALGRALSRIADASVEEALAGLVEPPARSARRIGITGPPGAGKSTLISGLARRRLDRGRSLGIVAIDPTSPFSHGAILGDRIRMEEIGDDPRLFIRSLASRGAHDGLADNIPDILLTMDAHGFDEVVLETVGVGQAEYGVRLLVDTVVLVLIPESGDQIQAMKAGVLETADIYVVNKADLPGARKIAAELRGVLKIRRRLGATWEPPVILASAQDGEGVGALDEAVERHLEWLASTREPSELRRARARYHLQSLFARRIAEILESVPEILDGSSLAAGYRAALDHLGRRAETGNGRRETSF